MIHEATIGTVNRKELASLLARGLEEEAAVDLIIRGMIRGSFQGGELSYQYR